MAVIQQLLLAEGSGSGVTPTPGSGWSFDFFIADPDTFVDEVYTFLAPAYFTTTGTGCSITSDTACTNLPNANFWIHATRPPLSCSIGVVPFGSTTSFQFENAVANEAIIPIYGDSYNGDGKWHFQTGDKLYFKPRASDVPTGLTNVVLHMEGFYE
jgi:hypothetical protein